MIKLFLVDQDPFSIAGIRQILIEAPDILIVGVADSGEKALHLLEAFGDQRPQMVLSRARLPDRLRLQALQNEHGGASTGWTESRRHRAPRRRSTT